MINVCKIDQSSIKLFLRLMQNYEAEFSSITGKHPNSEGFYTLDTELDEKHEGYIAYDITVPIGFAVKGEHSNRHDISEFYIVPSYRRKGVGKEFAFIIFDLYSGKWQVRQIEGADKTTAFWRSIIKAYTNNNFEEVSDIDPYWGKVTKQTFLS